MQKRNRPAITSSANALGRGFAVRGLRWFITFSARVRPTGTVCQTRMLDERGAHFRRNVAPIRRRIISVLHAEIFVTLQYTSSSTRRIHVWFRIFFFFDIFFLYRSAEFYGDRMIEFTKIPIVLINQAIHFKPIYYSSIGFSTHYIWLPCQYTVDN